MNSVGDVVYSTGGRYIDHCTEKKKGGRRETDNLSKE